MEEQLNIRELISTLYPNYFLEKDIPKLITIFTAGRVDGLITASTIIKGYFDKNEAKDAIIEMLDKHTKAKP